LVCAEGVPRVITAIVVDEADATHAGGAVASDRPIVFAAGSLETDPAGFLGRLRAFLVPGHAAAVGICGADLGLTRAIAAPGSMLSLAARVHLAF